MARGDTKERIMDAATALFTTKGYDGTSIRDIASEAKVNAANISYYFDGKQGLLEACIVSFFEPYIRILEAELDYLEQEGPAVCLMRAVKDILHYQSDRHLLTRFVWREISIDSQVAREITSSYLMKERYVFKRIFNSISKERQSVYQVGMMIMQLKGMIMMPYLNSQYASKVWGILPQEPYFADKYYLYVQQWIQSFIGKASTQSQTISFPIAYSFG